MTLRARDLAIGHGGRRIGEGLSLALGRGEILCLLGPNGCGKTTLFRTLLGLLPPLGGEIHLGDRPMLRLSRAEIATRIAYVPQAHAPTFAFDVLEVVLMGRTARLGAFGQPGAKDRKIALEALERLGIAELAAQDYAQLSGGQRQLVMIARALAQDTSLIVLDEPTASLDFGNQVQVLDQIARLSKEEQGRGIVLSTHDPDQAFALEARVLLMSGGRIAAQGPAEEVLTAGALSAVYGVGIEVERTPSGRRVCLPARQSAATMTSEALTTA
ncbi:iron complex transport system ATP-binding protein [Poseidonocella pacifica]|uniref:Iron complex transport system ATP-binding protein n=1 Tax=Poseidonocella pacifica TaxID=871651 RepID=A0A1I0V9S5_9RHOB|nr:ABC transporter ATP-binding protein [Poseidonocella pacifica]SFA73134.1 iron complex transport system ATP-binding protein [Poseidonocella pacifica]